MLPTEIPGTGQFTEHLIRANGLDDSTFQEWVLCPGMRFGDSTQWWGDHRKRPTPHEGLDLCFYRNWKGRIESLDSNTQIPALCEGTVAGIIHDFLGLSVILRHQMPGDEATVFCTMYGHTIPESTMLIGRAVQEGEVIARLAPIRAGARVRAHLHLSIGIVPAAFSFEELDWATIGDLETVTLFDPLPEIGPASVVPHTALPGCGVSQ